MTDNLYNNSRSQYEESDSDSLKNNEILKHDHTFNAQFTKTGQRPQNFIKNVDPSLRYNRYPRLSQLMQEKTAWIKKRNHPPIYIKQDLHSFNLGMLGKFDVILCDPPWKEYEDRAKRSNLYMGREEEYKFNQIGETPSFLFLWVGSEHLQDGRQLMKAWGFKRCEDIVWVKTNNYRKNTPDQSAEGIFIRVKQHCLMGYKGQPKKVSDHNIVHPNIDIDVIVTEQPELASLKKPEEIYDIIERFCLGRKRIELFGNTGNIRNGWLTIGSDISETNFDENEYNSWFKGQMERPINFKGGRQLGTNATIQSLRPKQDSVSSQQNNNHSKQSQSANDDSTNGKRSLTKSQMSKS